MMAPLHPEYSSPGSPWPLSDHPSSQWLKYPSKDHLNVQETLKKIYNAHGQLCLHALVASRGKLCIFLDLHLLTLIRATLILILSVRISMTQSQQSRVIIWRISTFISRQLRHKKRLLTMAAGRPQWFIGLICLLPWPGLMLPI